MIEILVSVLILAIGLLGLASMQVVGLKNNQSAYLRSQASMLAYDIADRMRANRTRALENGDYDNLDTNGSTPSSPGCEASTSGCSNQQRATADIYEWHTQIKGSTSGVALLPNARGQITRNDRGTAGDVEDDIFTITINWDEATWDNDSQADVISAQSFTVNFSL